MSTRTFHQKVADWHWQVLVDSLTPRLADMAQLAADHAAPADVPARVRMLMATQGGDIEARLTASPRGALGPQSEQLIQLGVKPRPRDLRRPRRRAAAEPAQAAVL
jgi:hypothetical protein